MSVPAELVREELAQVIECPLFRRAPRLALFLRFLVEETLQGRSGELKEYTIGIEVYGRSADFDPRLDATVRVEARKLRARLNEYYLTFGAGHCIHIRLRAGSYTPEFAVQSSASSPSQLSARGFDLLARRTPRDLGQAYDCFWQAIVEHPNSSEGYAGLAAYYAVATAVELISPQEGLPHLRMALAQQKQLGAEGCDSAVLRAICAYADEGQVHPPKGAAEIVLRRYPRYAGAHFWLGAVLSAQGLHAEAIAHMQEATRLSPSALQHAHVSWMYYHAREHHAAYESLRRSLGGDTNDFTAAYLRGRILTELGRFDEAIDSLSALRENGPSGIVTGAMGYAYALAGQRRDAESVLDQLRQLSATEYVSPLRLAVLQAALGFTEDAAMSLERARRECSYSLIWQRVDPHMAQFQ